MNKPVELPDESLFAFKDEPGVAGPIVMVNLLRFRDQADYGDGEISCTGQQAYSTYSKAVIPLIFEVGGFPVWAGKVRSALLVGDDEQWDQVALIAYPSRKAFVDMHCNQAYVECVKHRNAGLADVRLIETRSIYFPRTLLRIAGLGFRLKAWLSPRPHIKKSSVNRD